MPDYAFSPPAIAALPIAGSDVLFPVRRVYCIGRNYAAHAVEMGHDPDREPPFFFQKNANALDTSGRFPYPPLTHDVHHEVEMLVALGSGGWNIAETAALDHVYGYGIALDMTRRDLQGEAKKMGRPWEIGKSFEHSAPAGPVHREHDVGHLAEGRISLSVNGEERQAGDLNQMIWKVPEMIAFLSAHYELSAGDVILSGTPAGVGSVEKGDRLQAEIQGLGRLTVEVV